MATIVTPTNLVAVGAGAAVGAICRWLLGLWLNHSGAFMPWGTLTANFLGALIIGVLLGFVLHYAEIPEWLRLMSITGFLGALTTFSTFSAETVGLLERGHYGVALGYVAVSLVGSLLLTALGLFAVQRLL